MTERTFTAELIKSFNNCPGVWAYKIPDDPGRRMRGFKVERPFDIVVCANGFFQAVECKQIKRWTSFGLKDLRPSQIKNLELVSRAHGEAWVYLNIRIKSSKRLVAENRILFFKWSEMKKQKVFTANQLRDRFHVVGKKGLFPIDPYLFS